METEKSKATAIPHFNEEQKAFIKDRLLNQVPYWQIVYLFVAVYPDFQPEGMNTDYYMDRLYQRINDHATNPRCAMSKEVKAANAETDALVAKLAQTDKYIQLATLTNYVEREWRPRTFVKTAKDPDGNEYPVYKDNIGQLIQCYSIINKLSAELGLMSNNDDKRAKTGKPINKRVAQAQAEGAPSLGDDPPTNEFPSRVGPPQKEEESPSPNLANPKIPIKV